jgi:hypothetical protein
MDKSQKPNDSECYTPASEPFTIYLENGMPSTAPVCCDTYEVTAELELIRISSDH